MANIRFVKHPNDNRIRSFPPTVMMNDVIKLPASAKNESVRNSGPKINNIMHITTPKRSANSISANDIFTNRNNNGQSQSIYSSANIEQLQKKSRHDFNDNMADTNVNFQISRNRSLQNCYSSYPNDTDQCAFHDLLISNSASSSEKDWNFNVQSTNETNGDVFEAMFTQENYEIPCIVDALPDEQSDTQDIDAEETSDFDEFFEKRALIHKLQLESATKQIMLNEDGEDKETCLVANTHSTVPEGELSEVLDEELDQLPDICAPGNVSMASVRQQDTKQVQHEQNKHVTPGEQQQQASIKRRQARNSTNKDMRYNETGSSRPIHRSISEAGLIDNAKVPSFFRSIKDARIGGQDKIEPLDIEEMTVCLSEKDDPTKLTEHRKFAQRAKIAWDSGIGNHRFEKSLDNVTNAEMMSAGKSPLAKFEAGHFMISRSLSRDSAINERLKMRRCALADPENMIMRQDVREKIEKEIEKRRTSMVRKISQFFNVHLNLNKEEDLI